VKRICCDEQIENDSIIEEEKKEIVQKSEKQKKSKTKSKLVDIENILQFLLEKNEKSAIRIIYEKYKDLVGLNEKFGKFNEVTLQH